MDPSEEGGDREDSRDVVEAVSPRRRRRQRVSRILTFAAIGGMALGALMVGTITAFPEESERAFGLAQLGIGQFRIDVIHELPAVTLGASGGMTELDRCDGTFTEMLSYRRDGVPPVWAAHNNCGGDTVLPWKLGQEVAVTRPDGSTEIYAVADVRVTPKTWATTDDLIGLGGDFALQTCFYGENRMRFVGLGPVDATESR